MRLFKGVMADFFSILFLQIASSANSLVCLNAQLATMWISAALRVFPAIKYVNARVLRFRECWLWAVAAQGWVPGRADQQVFCSFHISERWRRTGSNCMCKNPPQCSLNVPLLNGGKFASKICLPLNK